MFCWEKHLERQNFKSYNTCDRSFRWHMHLRSSRKAYSIHGPCPICRGSCKGAIQQVGLWIELIDLRMECTCQHFQPPLRWNRHGWIFFFIPFVEAWCYIASKGKEWREDHQGKPLLSLKWKILRSNCSILLLQMFIAFTNILFIFYFCSLFIGLMSLK